MRQAPVLYSKADLEELIYQSDVLGPTEAFLFSRYCWVHLWELLPSLWEALDLQGPKDLNLSHP